MTDQDRSKRMALMRRRAAALLPIRLKDRYQPARRVVRRSHLGPVGSIRSNRHGRVDYEHHLERDFIFRCVADPNVFDLRHQPMEVEWNDDGVKRKHYPDFSLRRGERRFVVEVKTAANSLDPLIQRRTAAMVRRFAREEITYELVTDTWIRQEPHLSNAKLLCLSLAYEPTDRFVSDLTDHMRSTPGGIAIEAIADLLNLPEDAIYLAYAMIRNGDARFVEPGELAGPHSRIVGGHEP